MPEYHSLTIQDLDSFLYGTSPNPVVLKNGLAIGAGTVYPELNFTLPDMIIHDGSIDSVYLQYTQIIEDACRRAIELFAPGLVVEFELLPDLTLVPEWGAHITRILREILHENETKHGLKTALRITPNDIREFARPPILRSGEYFEKMMSCFNLCAQFGADFLSIESTGGKEVHDDAILNCDLDLSVFALGVLASRDMSFLWERIVEISQRYGVIPAGDTACGFANTAMVLAEQHFIPRIWAAAIRVMSVPRSLIAFEKGAIGPSKDCAYEGPYLKAITGCPISLEGSEAAVAHLSPIGNITKAVPDLWSNESVNNVKLLGGMAPTVSLEQLIYATRLMNTVSSHGKAAAQTLRNWWVESDAKYDPQAFVLRPDVVLELAGQIIAEPTPYLRTRKAAQVTFARLRTAYEQGEITLSKPEIRWLDRLSKQASQLSENEDDFIAAVIPKVDRGKVRLSEYGLPG